MKLHLRHYSKERMLMMPGISITIIAIFPLESASLGLSDSASKPKGFIPNHCIST